MLSSLSDRFFQSQKIYVSRKFSKKESINEVALEEKAKQLHRYNRERKDQQQIEEEANELNSGREITI